jgi:hypothetical protein
MKSEILSGGPGRVPPAPTGLRRKPRVNPEFDPAINKYAYHFPKRGDAWLLSQKIYPFWSSGGGIGGLAAALALVRQGFKVQVFEQAPEIGEIGAGIQLGPNAFHAFDALGVGDKARSRSVLH